MTASKERNRPKENESPERSLAESREEIRAITRSILDLASVRQKLSLAVARDKVLLGQSITNPEVEKKLLAESAEYARSIGLDEDFARSLVLELIRFSKLAQTKDVYLPKVRKFLETRKIRTAAVVGSGRMGSWFAKYFKDLSLEVSLYDERLDRARDRAQYLGTGYFYDLKEVVTSDLILVSVPISQTPEIVAKISKLVAGNSKVPIIIEISSVKNELGLSGITMEEAEDEKIHLYSVHPLFGGSAHPFAENSIIQTFPKDTSLLRGLFPHSIIVTLDWKEHDKLMGVFLTLPHVLGLVFADTLLHYEKTLAQGINLNGPSFLHMLGLSRRVLEEDPGVYFEIQASNPNSKKAISDLMNSLLEVDKAMKNRSEFLELFKRARKEIDVLDDKQSKQFENH